MNLLKCTLPISQKHHDGFGLFDTGNTTDRNSVKLGPKRDFLAELFATAKKEKPRMHRGMYASLRVRDHADQRLPD